MAAVTVGRGTCAQGQGCECHIDWRCQVRGEAGCVVHLPAVSTAVEWAKNPGPGQSIQELPEAATNGMRAPRQELGLSGLNSGCVTLGGQLLSLSC